MKMLPFIANYKRELRIGTDIRRKEKVEKATEFAERMRKVQEEAGVALRKVQEEIRRQADRKQREVEEWKKRDKVILITKNLMFKEKPVKKLIEKYVGPYIVEKIVLKNVVKLKLLASMRIHPVVNVSGVVRCRESIKRQKVKELKLVEVNEVEKQEVEKILNKIKV